MVPPSEFEVSHSLSPCSATAASLLSCLHSAPGLSAPATMPPGLLPAGTAAWPPALSSAARAARSPAAKRSLPTGPSDLQPAGGAGPPPPTEPQPPALPQQLVPSATGDAGRSLKRKIVPVTGGDPGVRCGPPPCRRLWDPRMSRLTPGPRRSPGRRSGDPHSSKNSWGSTLGHFTYRDPHLGQLSPGTPGCRAGTPRWYSTNSQLHPLQPAAPPTPFAAATRAPSVSLILGHCASPRCASRRCGPGPGFVKSREFVSVRCLYLLARRCDCSVVV